jgi:hypothetical protein
MASIPELKSEIQHKNEEISQIAHQIEDRIEHYVDYKGMVARRPFVSVAACIGVGLLFSGALAPIVRLAGREVGGIAKAALMTAASAKIAQTMNERQMV